MAYLLECLIRNGLCVPPLPVWQQLNAFMHKALVSFLALYQLSLVCGIDHGDVGDSEVEPLLSLIKLLCRRHTDRDSTSLSLERSIIGVLHSA